MKQLFGFIALLTLINISAFSQIKVAHNYNHKISSASLQQMNALNQLQQVSSNIQAAWNENNATPTYLTGKLTSNNYLQNSVSPEIAAKKFITDNKVLFNLVSPNDELFLVKSEADKIGMTHVKLQQYFDNLKILGSQLIVHFDKNGAISSINGRYVPTPNISISAQINKTKSETIASQACKGIQAKSSELVIYIKDNQPVLAYEVQVPTKIAPKQKVIVDASNGNVFYKDTGIRYDGPDVASGVGTNGSTRSLNVYLSQGDYYLIDATKPMYVAPVDSLDGVIVTYDAKNYTDQNDPYKNASVVVDPNNDKNFNDNEALKAAVDAHYFTAKVYDYYKSTFGRNSWDNNGGSVTNVVHYLTKFNNAFWNGSFMTYGDGDSIQFSNLAGAFDVTAHEITHGITQSTAALEYEGQSGALNESYSDVMAAMADNANWTIGEDVYTPSISGDALRDLSNPHQGGSSPSDAGWQPATMGEFLYLPHTEDQDYGGVHINSGIPNHAAYLVANQIGRTKTEQIYYRTLVHYLTPKSQFIDARNLTLQSAIDLYGGGSAKYNAVASVFDGVGITSNLPKTNELSYDDGSPETKIYEADTNWGILNRLTAPANSTLANVEFYYGGDENTNGNGSFKIKIYDDGGSKPGNLVLSSSSFTPSANSQDYWLSISTVAQNLNVSGDFYVGIYYDGTNEPLIGVDTTVINARGWEWNDSLQTWIQLNSSSYFPVTVLIRATVNTLTAVHDISNEIPDDFVLSQNYPNPFNPSTTISYALPKESNVSLKIYDILGKEVASLVNESQPAGTYKVEWKGLNNRGEDLSSGIYLYKLSVGDKNFTKKMLFVK